MPLKKILEVPATPSNSPTYFESFPEQVFFKKEVKEKDEETQVKDTKKKP